MMFLKLKSIASAVLADLKDTWDRCKVFILAIIAIIVTLEFQKLKQFLLVYMSKKELKNNQKEDQVLVTKETTENKAADDLIAKSKTETAADNWNLK